MSLPDTNKKLLVKRHGASANINKKQKRSNVLPSIDVNQTNISLHETASLISSPNRNVSTRSKSAIQRSKTVTKTQSGMNILYYCLITVINKTFFRRV
jgi:hypothetical protein